MKNIWKNVKNDFNWLEEGYYLLATEEDCGIIFYTHHGPTYLCGNFEEGKDFDENVDMFFLKIPFNKCIMKKISSNKSPTISSAKKLIIFKKFNYSCVLCSNNPIIDPSIELHVDHIYPCSLGGSNHIDNLQLLCRQCNIKKSNKE